MLTAWETYSLHIGIGTTLDGSESACFGNRADIFLPMLSRFALCGYAFHSSAAFLLLSYQLTLFWSFAIFPSVYIFLYFNICLLVLCMSGLVESFAPPSKKSEVGQMSFSPTMPFSSSWRKCFQARWSSSTVLWLCLRFYRG